MVYFSWKYSRTKLTKPNRIEKITEMPTPSINFEHIERKSTMVKTLS